MTSEEKKAISSYGWFFNVARWNATGQEWLPEYITALLGYDFEIEAGDGIFVFISSGNTNWYGI